MWRSEQASRPASNQAIIIIIINQCQARTKKKASHICKTDTESTPPLICLLCSGLAAAAAAAAARPTCSLHQSCIGHSSVVLVAVQCPCPVVGPPRATSAKPSGYRDSLAAFDTTTSPLVSPTSPRVRYHWPGQLHHLFLPEMSPSDTRTQ